MFYKWFAITKTKLDVIADNPIIIFVSASVIKA